MVGIIIDTGKKCRRGRNDEEKVLEHDTGEWSKPVALKNETNTYRHALTHAHKVRE